MESVVLPTFGIINIISLSFLANDMKLLNIANTMIYVLSNVGSVLVEADKYNKMVVLSSIMFKLISIVWGIIIGVLVIATPDLFIKCSSISKYECVFTASVLPEFVGAIYIGSSFVSIYFWLSGYNFYRLLIRTQLNPA